MSLGFYVPDNDFDTLIGKRLKSKKSKMGSSCQIVQKKKHGSTGKRKGQKKKHGTINLIKRKRPNSINVKL